MQKIRFIALAGILVLLICSCKKESFITSTDARLLLSADTIKFDTVFTTVGSVTQSFKIFNGNDQKLLLSKVKLMGAATSAYRININGVAAFEQDNIEIASNDSIYVFVTVSINPNAATLPFIISDSILVNYNGNDRFVQLQAYGQNAHFLSSSLISTNTVWPNDLPYVILGGIRIDTNINLTISQGCKIYLHANAPFIVDGTLMVNGVKGNEVQFASDRLDEPYKNFPGGWQGIYFRGASRDNQLRFAVIKNAYQGIVISDPAPNSNPKLVLQQCIIDNAFDAGLLSFNSSVQADNTLISNCGNNIIIELGGIYTFSNCTIAAYSTTFLLHKNPVMSASNFVDQNGGTITADLDAVFSNCIFWGDNGTVDDEVVVNRQGSNVFIVTLDHCLYKAINDPSNTILTSVIKNQDPMFDSIDVSNRFYDFRINKNSFAPTIDQGITTGFLKDLDNNNRSIGLPDLGSYERQ